MVDKKTSDHHIITNKLKEELDAIDVPKGLKEELWQHVTISKPKKRYNKVIPYIAMAACLAMLIPLGFNQFQHHAGKTPATQANHDKAHTQVNSMATNKEKTTAKQIAQAFLEKLHYKIQSYDGEKTVSLTMDKVNSQPLLRLELLSMYAGITKNDIEMQGASLLAKPIRIETFTISGFWREKYSGSHSTKVAVVVTGQVLKSINRPIVSGYTVPVHGKPEEVWPIWSMHNEVSIVAKKGMDDKAIAEALYRKFLDQSMKSNVSPESKLAKYTIQSVTVTKHVFHGFDFDEASIILPADQKQYKTANPPNKTGWIQKNLIGKVYKVNQETYVLAGLGSGGQSDVIFDKSQGKSSQSTKSNNPLYNMTLTLPNGKTLTTDKGMKWKDLDIGFWISGAPLPLQHTNHPDYKGYIQSVVGNHSSIQNYSLIDTSAGKAVLALNKRTPPAASQSTKATYEYWVAIYKNKLTYAIEAQVIGDKSKAKQEILQLVKHWKVP